MSDAFDIIADKITDEIRGILKRVYSQGYSAGLAAGKEKFGQEKGITSCQRASKEDVERYGTELFGWCSCGRPIEGRWVGAINFCPWCGKLIEWKGPENENNNA